MGHVAYYHEGRRKVDTDGGSTDSSYGVHPSMKTNQWLGGKGGVWPQTNLRICLSAKGKANRTHSH